MSSFKGRQSGFMIDAPIFAASLSLNVLSLMLPIAILQVFDRVIPYQSISTLQMLGLILFISTAAEFFLRWSRTVLLTAAAERAAVENHNKFLQCVLGANEVAFAKSSVAVYLERFSAVGRMRDYFSGQNQTLAIDIPFTAVFVLMIGLIGGWLIMVPLGCLLFVLVSAAVLKRIQGPIFNNRKSLDARRYTFLAEVLSNIPTVKANTMERSLARRFELLADQTTKTSHSLIMFSGLSQSFGLLLSQLAVAAMGILGAFLVIENRIGIAELAACMLLNGRVIQPLMKLLSHWLQSETVNSARSKLMEMEEIQRSSATTSDRPPMIGTLAGQRVSMTHPINGSNIIPGASFQIKPGQTVLITGVDNAATNVFFDAILGQRKLESGTLLVDGHLPEDRMAQRGPDGIVALENDAAMFNGTILENISAFGDAARIDYARKIAEMLDLERRVFRLPHGFDTMLNNGGIFESDPINRKLISLTRALALQPKILLMNEPSAILETAERKILAACLTALEPKPTILLFSPDPRMRAIADCAIDLSETSNPSVDLWLEDAKNDGAIVPEIVHRGVA